METRSRKRAEASPAAHPPSPPSTRSSKRRRLSPARTHPAAQPPMETECSSSRGRRRGQGVAARPQGSGSRDKCGGGGGSEKGSSGGKGKEKEKETEAKGRERDPGFGFDGISRDHDDDSDGGGVPQNVGPAGCVLQGLLRKIGVGLDDLIPASGLLPSSSSQRNLRFKNILLGLRSDGEEGRQVEALTQLCEMLSIGTEDSLSTFSVDSYVPVLVGLLNHESNADIMLLSARAITHLCDVLPSSCAAVVHYGAVPCFCARLLTIEYMDLAEQSLQALKKISQEHPTACLRSGALLAVLSYLDFFSTGVQRVALSTAANMCKKLTSDSADFVIDAVPLLTNLLQHHDAKVLEYASICLTRIAEAFSSSPEKLDALCNHGLVSQAASLISISSSGVAQASLSTSTYTGIIRLLSICVSGSAIGAKALFLLGISRILKEILSGSGEVSSIFVLPVLNRPPEQILELVKLADELLPPWPQGAISLPSSSNSLLRGSSAMKKSLATVSVKKEDSAGGVAELSAREQLLRDQPKLLQQFGVDLLPVLVQVYESSVSGHVRHKCLSVIGKLMFFSTADMIESSLRSTNVASFLAGILASKDSQALIPSLGIAKILMEKLPGTFSKMFVREGVMHAVDMLISADSSLAVQADSAEKKDILQEVSQTRRGKRRTGSHNVRIGSHEDSNMLVAGSTGLPASVEASSVNSNYRTRVSAHAKAFKDKYFPADTVASELFAMDDLLHLKNLCGKLNVGMNNSKARGKGKSKASASHLPEISSPNEEHLIGIISELLLQLSKNGGVSTFEFTSSGIVLALLNYFSCGTFSKDKVPEAEMTKFRKQAIKRFKSFVSVALPTGMHEANNRALLTVLIQKLQSALSSLERFQVTLSHPSRSSNGTARLSTGFSALAQPLKLRLCRAHGEKTVRDFSSKIVLIDPLASIAAVEDFLWPRVHQGESGQKPLSTSSTSEAAQVPSGFTASPSAGAHASSGRRSSTRLRSSVSVGVGSIAGEGSKKVSYEGLDNLSKGKGKAIVKSSSDDIKGPQTRSSTCRKAVSVSDKGACMKSVHTRLEDVDLDVSYSDMDDELVIEDDDISEDDNDQEMLADDCHPVMPEKVHDVRLNDTAEDSVTPSASVECQTSVTDINERSKPGRGADPIEFCGSAPCASRGAMSFAAAAMAGLTSGGSISIRSSKDQRGLLIGSSNDSPKLVFSAGGKEISRNLTIYQAVQQQLVFDEDDDERYTSSDPLSGEGSRLLSDVHTITYQKADNQVDLGAYDDSTSSSVPKSGRSLSTSRSSNDSVWKQTSLLDSILLGDLPCDMEKSNPTYNILALLRVLNGLNHLAPRLRVLAASDDFVEGRVSNFDELITSGAVVPSEEFINGKLTPKLARQVQDSLALCSGFFPSWCYQLTKACPFLFSFETRRQFFYSTAFGLSRALHRLQQQGLENQGSTGEREERFRRLKRQKVRVSRNRILDSAAKVMEMYSSQKAVLEVEYFGEVGTGLGPTLEFYTLLSHDLQKVNLGMWRSSGTSDNSSMEIDLDKQKERNVVPHTILENGATAGVHYVHAPLGLFPRPWPPSVDFSEGSQYYKVVDYFRLVGQVMAKALQDGRLMDLPLSPAFYKLVLGQELDLHDISLFDAELGKTLQELQLLVWRKQYLEFVGATNLIADLRFRGASIEDLCLDFTLPGYPDYVLKLGEENTMVDINNLEEYISLVVDATTKAGIMQQMEAFRTGFSQVFDITSLQIFSPHELDYLLCGHRELWKAATLVDHIKFDHGYTAKSHAIINLLEIMAEFTPEQQRAFCQFVTGAPQLPPGGLAVLNPKLTIVRKRTSPVASMPSNSGVLSESGDDNLLPSVMTCANYLKLPSYSTKEIMYKKLLYAICEGQGSFDLS